MKTQDIAINSVYSLLTAAGASHDVEDTFKWLKPASSKLTEYIVVNALPVNAGVLQMIRVNVNFFCKDKYSGVPNTARLEQVTADLMKDLTQVDINSLMIDFESQEYIWEPQTGFHFSNIRLKVKMIN